MAKRKPLLLRLADAGWAHVLALHWKHIGMDIAERIPDLIDDERELAAGPIAEIDRQRIEGVAEEARIAQQQHLSAGEVDSLFGRTSLRVLA